MDTELRILKSAEELFLLQGYRKTSIRQIMERCGCNLGLFSYYFKSKEVLASTVYKKLMTTMLKTAEILQSLDGRDPIEKIYLFYVLMHKNALRNPALYKFYRELICEDIVATIPLAHTYSLLLEIADGYHLTITKEQIEQYALIVKGAERALVIRDMEQYGSDISHEIDNRLLVLTLVLLMGVERNTVLNILDRCDQELLTQQA